MHRRLLEQDNRLDALAVQELVIGLRIVTLVSQQVFGVEPPVSLFRLIGQQWKYLRRGLLQIYQPVSIFPYIPPIVLQYPRDRTKVPATHNQELINNDATDRKILGPKLRPGGSRSLPGVPNAWKPQKPLGTLTWNHLEIYKYQYMITDRRLKNQEPGTDLPKCLCQSKR